MVIVVELQVGTLQRVEQVEIEITGAGAFEARVELLLGRGLVMALEPGAELGGELEIPARATFHERFFNGLFGAPVIVDIGRIEVDESGIQEQIGHASDLPDIDLLAVSEFRQPHKSKAKLGHLFSKICGHFSYLPW